MSTTHYEININLDGEKWTPEQLESLGRGLREAERGEVFPVAALWDGIEGVDDEIAQTEDETAEWFTGEYGTISEEDREWMAADLSARPDTWEIEEPMRFQSFAHMPLSDRGQAECITVLAYHLWQLEERLTGGDGSHKSCDPIRIGYAPHSQYTAYSYVFSKLDGELFFNLADLEAALIRAFADRMTNLLANGRKGEGAKW